jgi:hypothetical protein
MLQKIGKNYILKTVNFISWHWLLKGLGPLGLTFPRGSCGQKRRYQIRLNA